MKTTLNAIRAHSPCAPSWEKLLTTLGKTKADDEPLSIITILDSWLRGRISLTTTLHHTTGTTSPLE